MKFLMYVIGIIFSLIVVMSMFFPFLNVYAKMEKIPDPYYFLVLGMDTTDVNEKVSRTDSILLVGVSEKKNKILVLPIPRDLLVNIEKETLRINAVYVKYGIEKLQKIIQDIFKVKISDYLIFDYGLFKEIGEIYAPVKIYVPKDMYYEDFHQNLHINFKQGYNYLNGEELLYYARFRYDALGDLGRIQRQKDVLFALMGEAKNSGLSKVLYSIDKVLNRTVNSFDYKKLFSLFLITKKSEINFLSLPIEIVGDYVKINNDQIKYTNKYLVDFEKPLKKEKIWVTLINNMESFKLSFYTITRQRWTNAQGYLIEIVDILPNIDGIDHNKSYLIIKNDKYERKILNEIKNRYSKITFKLIDAKQNPTQYFSIIKFLSDNFYNTLNSDVIILVGSNS
ncbi:transcriptional attenuator, LytR family [Marinitoga hydrogenitolerans DSM 16785]|uniref:Transcriptional attenuator, LytR family n=1 Tax=Marinitoga hydrogenitolerans (strain DSM 16785 / JCM 12826 / AT1271) TaxID=1122195 RepID=A0A1M4X1E2_MARH1|nr:LCP family protein [Marinitoga hydrogenitolerans]SHE87318.1 transcriptional attenuator, LytR family [Marinitoga hydrogenitolerans DSM 16785]